MQFFKFKNHSKKIYIAVAIILIFVGAYLNETKRLSVGYYIDLIGFNSFKNKIYNYFVHNNNIDPTFKVIHSNYYNLKLTKLPISSFMPYGGLGILKNNKLLYLDTDGNGFVYDGSSSKSIVVPKLPNHKKEFLKSFPVYSPLFGIKDIYINNLNEKQSLIVTTTNFNIKKECYFLSVFKSDISENQDTFHFSNWTNLFNSQPCLSKHAKEEFAGTSQGGRIVGNGGKNIYVSIGDFYFDGVNEKDKTGNLSDYGTIIEINLTNLNSARKIANGLRNPQGLFIDKDNIYETEHGPQGGDELNVIKLHSNMNNYGWPSATFGVDYGKNDWPLDPLNINHIMDGYIPPIFSWIPSIGISNLLMFKSEGSLKRWDGNLIIASLREESLYRVFLNQDKVVYVEKINVGFRIRDILQINDNLYLLEDSQPSKIWKLSVIK